LWEHGRCVCRLRDVGHGARVPGQRLVWLCDGGRLRAWKGMYRLDVCHILHGGTGVQRHLLRRCDVPDRNESWSMRSERRRVCRLHDIDGRPRVRVRPNVRLRIELRLHRAEYVRGGWDGWRVRLHAHRLRRSVWLSFGWLRGHSAMWQLRLGRLLQRERVRRRRYRDPMWEQRRRVRGVYRREARMREHQRWPVRVRLPQRLLPESRDL
jgi:hypothetical protein